MIKFDQIKAPYMIAEIGINHNGDIQVAKRLMDAAFACGWDCVKYQKRSPDISVPESQKKNRRRTPWGEMSYLEYKHKIEFQKKEYDIIDKYCKEKPIDWTASVWDLESLEFLLQYDVPFIKIPSAQLTNHVLVEAVGQSGRPVVMSTGMSSLEEVDSSVKSLKKHTSNFLLMHTNSAYPTPKEEVNLRVIKTLQERYQCPVGYSGHEYGLEASSIAVAMGACFIERHITLDHTMWGTDQSSSIEIVGMDRLIRRTKDVPKFLGSSEKSISKTEWEVRKKLRDEK